MADNKDVWVPSQGFITKMVDSTPRIVTAAIGSFLGVSLSIVIVLKIGGLDSVVVRIANNYAASMEQQVDDLSAQTQKLSGIVRQLDSVSDKLTAFDTRIRVLENTTHETSASVSIASLEIKTTKQGVERLMLWACTQEDKKDVRKTLLRCEAQ